MATTQQPKTVAEEQTERTIESGRLHRTFTEHMAVEQTAPGMYEITNGDGVTRTVDVKLGSCQCSDYEYRGDEFVCKHVLRACVHAIYSEGVRTELQGRIAGEMRALGYSHDHLSITDGTDCAGPLGCGIFLCPDCVQASPGSWSAWKFLMPDEMVSIEGTESTPRIATAEVGR